jgi:predicted TIM-barrel fold metal-dependent hydrolase
MKTKLDFEIPDFEIFDFHSHVSTIEEFDENLKRFNISDFCLMPSMIENDFNDLASYMQKIKPYIEKYKDKAIIFGFLDFSKNPEENLELLTKQKEIIKIKGIKIHPDQNFSLIKDVLKPYFESMIEVLGEKTPIYIHMDWPLIEENGYAPRGKKSTFNKIVSFFPEFKFIMGHAGGSGDYISIWKSCKKYSNVYIETSMAPVTSTLSEVVWKVGHERILFGSNYPYCGTSIEITKILSMYKVSDDEKKAILTSNWEDLISL